jgi:ABC-type branched-subunit amino acid transport system ATPase component
MIVINFDRNVLKLTGCSAGVHGRDILKDISLKLCPGTITVLFGLNGSGKTAVCDLISGMLRLSRGTISVSDKDVSTMEPEERFSTFLSRLFQKTDFFTRLTVREILWLFSAKRSSCKPDSMTLWSRGSLHTRIDYYWISKFGVSDYIDEFEASLSIGQRRLVNIAAALERNMPIVILDEPFSGLSASATNMVIDVLDEEKSKGKAILVVEHKLDQLLKIADHSLFIHEGRIVTEGNPKAVLYSNIVREYYGNETI